MDLSFSTACCPPSLTVECTELPLTHRHSSSCKETGKVPNFPMSSTLQEMVSHAASKHGRRNAVCFHSFQEAPVFYTYSKMMQLAEELALFLKSHCCYMETCKIGLYCNPVINLPSYIIGILQVPAAYFPIDPSNPSDISTKLMEKSNVEYMLVHKDIVENFKLQFPGCLELDSTSIHHLDVNLFEVKRIEKSVVLPARVDLSENTSRLDLLRQQNVTTEEKHKENLMYEEHMDIREKHCLAYILHTSGTTGAPKIVSVPHRCIVPNIHHLRSIFEISPNDLLFLASPLTFDPSVIELFLALSSGACLLIVPNPIKMMPHKLCDILFHQHRVTVLQVTPTFLRRFGSHSIRSSVLSKGTSLRVLALGGEPFQALSVIRSWKEPGNRTRLINLYGITEVSSWATYFEITEQMISHQTREESCVPLGVPLQGTIVEVQREKGCKIEEGQVLIGGRERICFLDDEFILPYGTMRKTGDWVTLKDGEMYFLGRKDNQIKRNGKRLNIEYVQQSAESLAHVEACTALWFQAKQLILFVIPNGPLEKKFLWKELQSHLLSYAVPDDLVLVETLPLTKHGKMDVSRLNDMYREYLNVRKSSCSLPDSEDLWNSLQCLWKAILDLSEDSPAVPEDSVFLLSGGDSLKAIRFQQEVDNLVGRPVTGLVEVILNDNFLDIYRHISKSVQLTEEHGNTDLNQSTADNLRNIHDGEKRRQHSGKRKDQAIMELEGNRSFFISLSKGSRLFVYEPLSSDIMAQQSKLFTGLNHKLSNLFEIHCMNCDSKRLKKSQCRCCSQCSPSSGVASSQTGGLLYSSLCLQERWTSDTGKCVDASPLLVISASKDSPVIYIGSHSHRMQALDLQNGQVIWERVLGDRIESSAGVSKCGRFVLVGCYDGSLYALCNHSGETHWIFTTENAVKSSSATDSISGLVYIGSHDGHIYALDIERKQCIWKSHCGGGAVFSSPCVSTKPYHLYVATLGGLVIALHPPTGRTIWTYACGKPVFSSLQCSHDHLFVGCVDENYYCLSHAGEMVWHLRTDGPIFSSPCLSDFSGCSVFGSHDGYIYCCSSEGLLLWKHKTSSKVYATPFVFPNPCIEASELVAAASTDGDLYILDVQSGSLMAQYRLSGQIFSSPVVWESTLIVGCRNNYVYCLDLSCKNAIK
ncbi:beta-alanine-activating enzyme [Xenopus laevis]|uniref:Carrier domain-containing protein n=2 Tax=Xenopus laevis TaxID=8355 RepID=A0A974DYC9_XENLA|nr:beta-alanine-activating enzyme [Xenopus laevis]OCT99521.1 hypothetical protein XELAEV_18005303mg [Xenopus laevis]